VAACGWGLRVELGGALEWSWGGSVEWYSRGAPVEARGSAQWSWGGNIGWCSSRSVGGGSGATRGRVDDGETVLGKTMEKGAMRGVSRNVRW
jgi:hypothetical protein